MAKAARRSPASRFCYFPKVFKLSEDLKRLFNNICEFTGQKVRDGFISELKEHSGGYVTETKV